MAEAFPRIPDHSIIATLGRGGMATVYLARDEKLRRQVALKVMDASLGDQDPSFIKRFVREAQTAASLTHPHIVPVYQYGETDDGRHWLTMAYLEGGSLKDRLAQGRMPPEEAIGVARQIASALVPAHARNIVHRDLKPDNILFQGESASLTDFGIAKLLDASTQLTEVGSPGTVRYMSPEQAWGEPLDHRSDLYSLGVVLYEMLTGNMPTSGGSMRAVVANIAHEPPAPLEGDLAGLQPLLDLLLAKDPADRFGSAVEVVQALEAVQRNLMAGADLAHATDGVPMRPSGEAAPRVDEDAADADAPTEVSARPARETAPARAATAPAAPLAPAAAAQAPAESAASGGGKRTLAVVLGSLVVLLGAAVVIVVQTDVLPGLRDALTGTGNRAGPSPAAPGGPAGSPSAGTGMLAVQSDPAGAEILIDGQPAGTTPATIRDVSAGKHRLELRLAGFEPADLGEVEIRAGRVSNRTHDMIRAAGELTLLSSPMNAWIEIDGERRSERTPVTLAAIPAGRHSVRMGREGYSPAEREVLVPRNGLTSVELELAPAPVGQLSIEVEPANARIVLPDIAPRYSAGMTLEPGQYRIIASAPGYERSERRVTIRPGEHTRERIALTRSPAPAAPAAPPSPAASTLWSSLEPGQVMAELGSDRIEQAAASATVPEQFYHYYLSFNDGCSGDDNSGQIYFGRRWDRTSAPYFWVAYGDSDDYEVCSFTDLVYLGPVWDDAFVGFSAQARAAEGRPPLNGNYFALRTFAPQAGPRTANQESPSPHQGSGQSQSGFGFEDQVGGSTPWDEAVKAFLLTNFDLDGSGSIASANEVQAVPCAVWQGIEASYASGELDSSFAHLYGFDGSSWLGYLVGFDAGVAGLAYDAMQSCGLAE